MTPTPNTRAASRASDSAANSPNGAVRSLGALSQHSPSAHPVIGDVSAAVAPQPVSALTTNSRSLGKRPPFSPTPGGGCADPGNLPDGNYPGNASGDRGLFPILSTSTATAAELQVLEYRDRWTAHRTSAALACDMRGVREAQDHIDAAGLYLVKLAAGRG